MLPIIKTLFLLSLYHLLKEVVVLCVISLEPSSILWPLLPYCTFLDLDYPLQPFVPSSPKSLWNGRTSRFHIPFSLFLFYPLPSKMSVHLSTRTNVLSLLSPLYPGWPRSLHPSTRLPWRRVFRVIVKRRRRLCEILKTIHNRFMKGFRDTMKWEGGR